MKRSSRSFRALLSCLQRRAQQQQLPRYGPCPLRHLRSFASLQNKSASFHVDSSGQEEEFSPHPLAASEKDEPWKTLLEMPARAAWRVTNSSGPPPDLQAALTAVLDEGGRNRKQLRRTHESVMQQQKALADRRDRERQRLLQNREYKPIDQQRDEGIQSVMYGPDEALASFYFRLFPHYAVVKRVLEEARSLLGRQSRSSSTSTPADDLVSRQVFQPTRVLDFGVGCGSASAAALHVFPQSIEWVHGIDPSQTMRDGAKHFLDEFLQQRQTKDAASSSNKTVPRTTFSAHISAESAGAVLPPGTFDLALFVYTATELPHNAATLAAAAVCWEKLRPGGLLVMIEPGTPDGFSSVRTVRNMLLDCFSGGSHDHAEETCHIIAPCTHNGRCPMERFQLNKGKLLKKTQRNADDVEDDEEDESEKGRSEGEDDDQDDDDGTRKGYCSFVQGMPGGTGGGKGEKFSYIVAQKRAVAADQEESPPHRFDDVNLPDLLQRTLTSAMTVKGIQDPAPDKDLLKEAVALEARFLASDDDDLGLEFLRGDANRQTYGRIIHAPKKKKGHVLIDICCSPGNIVRSKISKSMSKQIPGIYSASRKSRWGGLWPDVLDLQE